MSLINLEGEREATTRRTLTYGKKVIRYLELRSYFLVSDASIDGVLPDKIFRRPKFDGKKDTVVEVKDTDLSLSDKDFLSEFGRYFVLHMSQPTQKRFYFKMIARRLRNISRWRKIFDEAKTDDSEIKWFRNHIIASLAEQDSQKFQAYGEEDFRGFLFHTQVIQVGYERLLQLIEELQHSKEFDTDSDFLKEEDNLLYENENIVGNFVKVLGFPEKIYAAKLKKSVGLASFWRRYDADLYVPHKQMLYSLEPFPKDLIDGHLIKSSCGMIDMADLKFKADDLLNFKKKLVKSFVLRKGKTVGYRYNRKTSSLYFTHPFPKQPERKIKGPASRRRVVTRAYSTKGRLNFIAHRGLKVWVTNIGSNIYIIFNFFRLFSRDGKKIMTGDDAKKLHYSFPPTRAYNNVEKSKWNFLVSLLNLRITGLFSHPFVSTSKPVTLIMPCQPSKGEIFGEDTKFKGGLYEFF